MRSIWDCELFTHKKSTEQNAYYTCLYGLTRDELRYTLRIDPKEVYAEDFPGRRSAC